MFDIKVSEEQIAFVEDLLKTVNFGNRGDIDGTYAQQRTGIISQTVICDLLGQERPKGSGFDGGVDLELHGLTVDVKSMGRTVACRDDFVSNFVGSQMKYKTDILLFLSLNTKTNWLTVNGWIPKEAFKEKASFFACNAKRVRDDGKSFPVRGKSGLYEIKNSLLFNLKNIDDFDKALKSLSKSLA